MYDLEIPGPNTWIAGAGVVSHNSGQIGGGRRLWNDALPGRLLDRDSEWPGEMDIVRKNRQGKLGQVTTRIDSRLRHLPVERAM
ncbi:MAG: hypothetical protein ACXVUE_19180 [Solirubrobacteraceae bacterium]